MTQFSPVTLSAEDVNNVELSAADVHKITLSVIDWFYVQILNAIIAQSGASFGAQVAARCPAIIIGSAGMGLGATAELDAGSVALWTPAELGSSVCKLWLDASDISTITKDGSGYVSQWNDKSGNNYYAAQGTGSYQPQYKAADDVSSMPAVDWTKWTNAQQYMDVYDASDTRASFANIGDLFTVASYKDGIDSDADDYDRIVDAGDDRSHGEYLAINKEGSTLQTNRILRSVSFNGSGSYSTTIFPMSGDICHFVANSILQNKYIRIGADTSTYVAARKWRGPVHELIIISRNLTTTERQKVEGYLAHKWGLTAKLPVEHPYKSSAPTV